MEDNTPHSGATDAPIDKVDNTFTEPPDMSELEALQKQLEEAKAKATEHWDTLLRTKADFENFKKRAGKERSESARYAALPVLHSMLTVLDNFEMALAATDQSGEESMQSLKTGINMIHQQFKAALVEHGLEEIDAQGQEFDPNIHDAVSQQTSSEHREGHVLQQLRKGYRLHDRLLRPASVIVAKAPSKDPVDKPVDESADESIDVPPPTPSNPAEPN